MLSRCSCFSFATCAFAHVLDPMTYLLTLVVITLTNIDEAGKYYSSFSKLISHPSTNISGDRTTRNQSSRTSAIYLVYINLYPTMPLKLYSVYLMFRKMDNTVNVFDRVLSISINDKLIFAEFEILKNAKKGSTIYSLRWSYRSS